jgi:hypoxanthine-guanine phosphoribosyltransferase
LDDNDMGPDLKQVLITTEQLQARISELAAQIDADYAGRDLLLVGVLKGAVMVMADLARAMHLPVQIPASRCPGWRATCARARPRRWPCAPCSVSRDPPRCR